MVFVDSDMDDMGLQSENDVVLVPVDEKQPSSQTVPQRLDEIPLIDEESCIICIDKLTNSSLALIPCCKVLVCKTCCSRWFETCCKNGVQPTCPGGTCGALPWAFLESSCLIDATLRQKIPYLCDPSIAGVVTRREPLIDWAANVIWKVLYTRPCPCCHVRVFKDGGCNHVTCSQCSGQFCWRCGNRLGSTHRTCRTWTERFVVYTWPFLLALFGFAVWRSFQCLGYNFSDAFSLFRSSSIFLLEVVHGISWWASALSALTLFGLLVFDLFRRLHSPRTSKNPHRAWSRKIRLELLTNTMYVAAAVAFSIELLIWRLPHWFPPRLVAHGHLGGRILLWQCLNASVAVFAWRRFLKLASEAETQDGIERLRRQVAAGRAVVGPQGLPDVARPRGTLRRCCALLALPMASLLLTSVVLVLSLGPAFPAHGASPIDSAAAPQLGGATALNVSAPATYTVSAPTSSALAAV